MIRPFVHYAFRVMNNLYVGNKRAANELLFQISNQITTIINCDALQIHIVDQNVQVVSFQWLDTEDQMIVTSEHIDLVYKVIENSKMKEESVLVCCQGNKSIVIVAAYLMKKFRWNLKSVLQYLQICRKDLNIREGYLFQLSLYEKTLPKRITSDDEEEILLKHTYFNAKLGEIWKSIGEQKFKLKKKMKKISWSPQLVTIIKTENLLSTGYLKDYCEENNQLSEIIYNSKSYFLSKRGRQYKKQISKSNNQSRILPMLTGIPERSVSVTFESNRFASNRKQPTKGQMKIKYSKGLVKFQMK